MDRHLAIRKAHPSAVIINGDGENTEAWDTDGKVVSLDEDKIATEFAKIQSEYDSLEYSRNRQADYPSIADQLDDLYHNGIDGWKANIKVTKDKYPK